MADEERKPVARRVFRILAGVLAVLCFLLAAGFAFLPNMGGAELIRFFVASGVVIAGLALRPGSH
jgi:peptidoglycan/LPS O-acetylase OafA/YrhL